MVFRGTPKRSLSDTLFSPSFNSGGPTHHFGQSRPKRCPESDQKVTFLITFDVKKRQKRREKDTLFRLFWLLTDSGGPSLPSGSELYRKQRKTAVSTLFSAVFMPLTCPEHAQWPGHASDDTFDASFQKSKIESEDDIYVIERRSLDDINVIFALY